MYELCALLDRLWISRTQSKELYFEVRRALPEYHRLINDQLGWNLIANESIIKLEKVPPRSMPWMGIEEFIEVMDYCLLCALLLYLADQEEGGQFLLSSLTEAVEVFVADICSINWNLFSHRKSLVRVLRYAQGNGLIVAYDGNSESFGGSREQEVLYENTGLCRHFMVHFGRDISGCRSVEDFESFAWEGDAERGRKRVNRVYRQLLLSPALYWSESDQSDYDYVKNQRQWIEKYIGEAIGGELQIHKNGAFVVMEQAERFGDCFPKDSSMHDVVLLFCAHLRELVSSGVLVRRADDRVALTHREFRREVARCRELFGNGWSKQIRECSDEKLADNLMTTMRGWMMLEDCADNLLLCPAAAKWVGHYPKNYCTGEAQDDEPLEDA